MKRRILSLTLALWAATSAGAVSAETLRGEAGSTATLATVVLQSTAKNLSESDVSLRLNTDQTLTRSALKLAAGQIDVSVVPPNAWNAMMRGVGPYSQSADQAKELAPNLRSLFSFVTGTFHPIVWADSGIESWEDIAGKRVFVGPPGGTAARQITGLIEIATGYKPDVDYEAIKLGWGAGVSAFQDGQFDVLINPGVIGSAAITQLGLVRPIRLLSLTPDEVASDAYASFLRANNAVPGSVPPNTYEGQVNNDQEIFTNSIVMLISVHQDLSEDAAYDLTKAFWDTLEEDASANDLLNGLVGADPFVGNPMPLHAGAIKYFDEAGIAVPSNLRTN